MAGLRLPTLLSDQDAGVRGTNDDAQISKLSCVKAGYFKDEFVHLFVRRGVKRAPLINRGYYARWAALRALLQQFLHAARTSESQVLSLGAGFDTTWLQLQSAGTAPTRYCELDFKEVTQRKAALLASQPELKDLLSGAGASSVSVAATTAGETTEDTAGASGVIDSAAGEVVSASYCLLPVDLRSQEQLQGALQRAGFKSSAPTLILSECVLVYLEPAASAAVMACLGHHFTNAAMVVYEQIKPDDAFGRQMLSNLEARGVPLRGLTAVPSLQAQRARFLDAGWQHSHALDMETVYTRHLDAVDKARIERLEVFDEFEEWQLIQQHYCISVGVNDADGILSGFGFT